MLADFCALSPSHFHREFKRHTGLTAAKYIERVRLAQAAQDIVLGEETILSIALAAGYASHETFTRAFKRQYELAPSTYRFLGRHLSTAEPPDRESEAATGFGRWQIGQTRIQHTRALQTITLRAVGPYEAAAPELWDRVLLQLNRQKIATGALIGIAHDPPESAPADTMRFDAGVVCLQEVGDVVSPLRVAQLPGRCWAVTAYAGLFRHLTEAYQAIIKQVAKRADIVIEAGSVMEVYHTHRLSGAQKINYLEVYMPVRIKHQNEEF